MLGTMVRSSMLCWLVMLLPLTSCRFASQSGVKDAVQAGNDLTNETVLKALQALGADIPGRQGDSRCAAACHVPSWHANISRRLLTVDWANLTKPALDCFKSSTVDADKLKCFRSDSGRYDPKKLGVLRAGAHLKYFKDIFAAAYPDEQQATAEHKLFIEGRDTAAAAPMPPQSPESPKPMTEEEFEAVLAVYSSPTGMERMSSFFVQTEDNTECKTEISPGMTTYLKSRTSKYNGNSWFDINMEKVQHREMTMYGCRYDSDNFDPYSDPVTKCFRSNDPNATWNDSQKVTWAQGWSRVREESGDFLEQNIRVLSLLDGATTNYWMRSSADGRFVGNGLSGLPKNDVTTCSAKQGSILDLKDNVHLFVDAPYDPGFCPDNKCFTFIAKSAAHFCSQKMLYPKQDNTRDTCLKLSETPKYCTDGKLGVYQHMSASLDGGSYTVIRSDNYTNDNGGDSIFQDPGVDSFAKDSSIAEFYVLCETGDPDCKSRLEQLDEIAGGTANFDDDTFYGITKKIPLEFSYEGDFGISPSGGLVSSRVATKARTQLSYRIHNYDLKAKKHEMLANVCMKGGKVSFSYDERFIVTHHYTEGRDWKEMNKGLPVAQQFTGPDDAKFLPYVKASSNIYITDLSTGKVQRLTFTNPGQFALYPHFRADGWLYFLLRDRSSASEKKDAVIATDAAIRMAIANPL